MVLNEIHLAKRLCEGLRDSMKGLVITPMMDPERQINGTSVDLRLGADFKVVKPTKYTHLDPRLPKEDIKRMVARYTEEIHIPPDAAFVLHPSSFALGSTLEHVSIPADCCGRLEGRSGLGRMGLQVHSTAGYVDAGFSGALTLELQNVGTLPILLFPGVRVAQISLHLCYATTKGYEERQGSYSRQTGAGGSQAFGDVEYEKLRARHAEVRKRQFVEAFPHDAYKEIVDLMNSKDPPPVEALWQYLISKIGAIGEAPPA